MYSRMKVEHTFFGSVLILAQIAATKFISIAQCTYSWSFSVSVDVCMMSSRKNFVQDSDVITPNDENNVTF
jgi:hypothetical protein